MCKLLVKSIFILCIISSFSCKKSSNYKPSIDELSVYDVENLGLSIQKALDSSDIRAVNKFYDEKALADRFLQKTSKTKILQFNRGYFRSFSRGFSFGEMIISEKSDGAFYDFINIYLDDNNDYHLIFRFFGDGINYHDHLVKVIDGEPKIVDTYIYYNGEFLSDTFKKIYQKTLNKVVFDNKNIDDIGILKDLEKLDEVRNLMAAGNYKKALKKYTKISNSSKQLKPFKITHLLITSNISEKVYLESIEDYKQAFPNDKSLALISIDGYIINKNYNKAFQNIDNLDRRVKGDSFLNFMRGNVYFHQKKYNKSLEMFSKVIKDFPGFIGAYDNKLTILVIENKYKEAVKLLDVIFNEFEANKEEMNANLKINYPRFTKSRLYKNWFNKK